MPDSHTTKATQKTPALVIYLIDISASMGDRFESATKIDYVNDVLERVLVRMVQRSTKGAVLSPRYRLAMAAYGSTVFDLLGGIQPLNVVALKGKPILSATGSTDTKSAFIWALDILKAELPNLAGRPAPIVCHLTDGQFTGDDPEPIACEIMDIFNDDGAVLLENIFVDSDLTTRPLPDLETWPGIFDIDDLKSPYARKLFNMSSPLPKSYADTVAEEGYALQTGCRMLVPGSDSALVELGFTMSGATPVR